MKRTYSILMLAAFAAGIVAGSLSLVPTWAQTVPTTTVTGTVTANLSATDNAVLDDIADGIAVTNAGTFATQAAQSGTWTVELGATDNAVLDSIADGIAVTNAGTFAVQVDGSALTALQLIDNIATVDDADFTSGTSSFVPLGGFYQSSVTACTDGDTCAAGLTTGRAVKVALSNADGSLVTYQADVTLGTDTYTETTSTGPLVGAVRNDTLAALANTDNEIAPLQVDASGALYVKVSDTSLTVDLGANNDVTVTSGTVTANLSATDNAVLDDIADGITVDLGANNDVTVTGTVTANLSATDNAVLDDIVDGTLQVQVSGDTLTALQLIDDAQTGDSVHYRTSAGATEDEHEVKATAGRLFSVAFTNTNAAVRYWRCANLTAANTTPGTSTVLLGLAIPGATTGAGFTHTFGPNGVAFSTALTCWFVTGAADSDVAEVAANEIKAIYTYK